MSYASVIAADGASHHWPLDETSGTTAVDRIGGKDGTISGGVTLGVTGSPSGTAMTFNGTTGKILTAASVSLPLVATVEAWMKSSLAAPGTLQAIFSTRMPGTTGTHFIGTQSGAPVIYYGAANVVPPGLVCDGQWRQVVYVLNGTTITFYIDGALTGSTYTLARSASTGLISIGFDDEAGFYFDGALDEVAIYPLALSPAQIAAHYALRSQGGGGGLLLLGVG